MAGGVCTAPARAAAIGAAWTQIFTKTPQQWFDPVFGDEERDGYRAACAEHGIVGTTVHACYLLNCASPSPDLYERSATGLAAELARCESIGADHLVVHAGSATDGDRRAGLQRKAEAIVRSLRTGQGRTRILIENTPGTRNLLGRDFAELTSIIGAIHDAAPDLAPFVGVCLDTCHLFAGGHDIVRDYDGVMANLERTIGRDRVLCWHLNDSAADLGSAIDRHAHIGEGKIGLDGFRHLMRDPRWLDVPMMIETPKDANAEEADRRNLGTLRALRAGDL
ncbi:MAG: deoxyribonuclease IV [Longimicrobiales bacterium]